MRIRKTLTLLSMLAVLCWPGDSAEADSGPRGTIRGTISNKDTGVGLPAARITITRSGSPDKTVWTNERGVFDTGPLAMGQYRLLISYGKTRLRIGPLRVEENKTTALRRALDVGEKVYVHGKKIAVEGDRARVVTRISRDDFERLAVPGNSFEGFLEIAPTAVDDGEGIAFGGTSSFESQYVLDGQSTSGLSYGNIGSPMSTELLEQVEIVTGGYMAEHGRATGAVINMDTRTGTNEFHGTIFSRFTNSLLQKRTTRAPLESWIDVESNLAYDLTMGATLGGPIIKDALFFFVGMVPRLIATDTDRITKRQTDCRARLEDGSLSACIPSLQDAAPDVDNNGFLIYEELDRKTLRSQATEYQFVSKLNLNLDADHAGQLTLSGTPFTRQDVGVLGEVQAVSRDVQVLTTDLSARWRSTFNDSKTRLDAQLGVHRSTFTSGSVDDSANRIPHERLVFGNFGDWAAGNNSLNPSQPRESLATVAGCRDSVDPDQDPYQFIENCPDTGIGYSVGGIGFLGDEEEQRTSGKLSVVQRIRAAGDHQLKAGIDFESGFLNKKRLISGDLYFTNEQGGRNRIEVFRYVALAPDGAPPERFPDACGRGNDGEEPVACNYTPPGDVRGQTLNLAGYLQDSWKPVPNLTINAGVRYEEQRLRNAEHLRDTTAIGTGETLGKNAMVLGDMWAPRLGLAYDWTKEGRSKLYGSWSRFYESVPMDINDRSFGGESWMRSTYDSADAGQCGPPNPGLGGDSATPSGDGCVGTGAAPAFGDRLTGAGILVARGVKAQYLDEAVLGVEYEVARDLTFGLNMQNRRLGRVLEDLSTDNANTYVLANPGSWSAEEERALETKIEESTDPNEQARLTNELRQFRGIRNFDSPRRDYNAITAKASRRFSRSMQVRASYTFSSTQGNYQGLFSSDTGQVDPNITSLFDLPELMANRDGPLPQDRPHMFKVDGFYSFSFEEAGTLSTGLSFRALSGSPVNATGAHYLYGRDETMLLPRGSMGRVDMNVNASAKLGYIRPLGNGMRLEGSIDVFNLNAFGVFGGQRTASIDQRYTRSNVNPIVGGRYEDLVYLKELDAGTGAETGRPVQRSRNFGNARSLLSAPSARLTARLSF